MSGGRDVAHRAGQVVAAGELPHPIYWPALEPGEAQREWEKLRRWVNRLRARYPHAVRLPECWWQHNDLVEVLAALRDCERTCFTAAAPASAAVEWQRAFREMELRIENWIKRFTCSVPGRGHDFPEPDDATPPDWDDFVRRDIDRRRGRTESGGGDLTEN